MTMAKALAKIAVMLAMFAGCGGDGVRTVFPLAGGTSGSTVPTGGVGGQTLTTLTGPNVLDVIVDSGPPGLNPPYTNGLFATATICAPGTSNCQTIDHLLVDTGSVGVRVLESVLTLSLPNATNSSGQAFAECAPFVDGTAWGPLKTADVQLGSEKAAGLTIHLIGENTYLMPASCTGTAITDFQTLAANGILGVGIFLQDCGSACALSARTASNPGAYYACSTPTGGCAVASVPTNQQVSHPVASFPVDNNGLIIQLPSISTSGAPSVPGQLIFGIGTQANNGLGGAIVVALDGYGYASTAFPVGGTAYPSIIDSGSNGLFFLDTATTKLTMCTGELKSFYCPSATTNLSATIAGASSGNARVDFSVANAARLSPSAFAFSNLAGPMPGYPSDPTLPGFDWGLPFFFGRNVYTAIEGKSTPAGTGPYVAF
jgi:hypothetical protein